MWIRPHGNPNWAFFRGRERKPPENSPYRATPAIDTRLPAGATKAAGRGPLPAALPAPWSTAHIFRNSALTRASIDCIATDHAPHAREKKMLELDRAPFGILGLETAVGLSVTRLVATGRIGWPRLIESLSTLPARILGLNRGTLRPGAVADVTLIDPERWWQVDINTFRSKSVNSPFHGWTLRGRAVATIVGGRVKYRLG